MNELVIDFLKAHFAESKLNRLPESYGGVKIFSKPLIGVASGRSNF